MDNRMRLRAVAAGLLTLVLVVGLAACTSDEDKAKKAVSGVLDGYVVPADDNQRKKPDDDAWASANFGDEATMGVLQTYGVDPDEWHRHCFSHFSYEVGEAVVEDKSAAVSVTVTNASLAGAVEAAGTDFAAFAQTDEVQTVSQEGGRPALFSKLVQGVYDHLGADEDLVSTTVSLTCTKDDDGTWTFDPAGDEEFFSALYGGSDVLAGLSAAANDTNGA